MNALDLARLQFAVTTSVHFLFVLVTLGLVTALVIMQARWTLGRRPADGRWYDPSPLLWAAALVPLCAAYGANLLRLRLPATSAPRAASLVPRRARLAALLVASSVAIGALPLMAGVARGYELGHGSRTGPTLRTHTAGAGDPAGAARGAAAVLVAVPRPGRPALRVVLLMPPDTGAAGA